MKQHPPFRSVTRHTSRSAAGFPTVPLAVHVRAVRRNAPVGTLPGPVEPRSPTHPILNSGALTMAARAATCVCGLPVQFLEQGGPPPATLFGSSLPVRHDLEPLGTSAGDHNADGCRLKVTIQNFVVFLQMQASTRSYPFCRSCLDPTTLAWCGMARTVRRSINICCLMKPEPCWGLYEELRTADMSE